MSKLPPLVLPTAYQAERQALFPSPTSLEWFTRQHRPLLLRAKALSVIAGRTQIDAEAFESVVAQVGLKQAARATA